MILAMHAHLRVSPARRAVAREHLMGALSSGNLPIDSCMGRWGRGAEGDTEEVA